MSKDEIEDLTNMFEAEKTIEELLEQNADENGLYVQIKIGFNNDESDEKSMFFQMQEFDLNEFEKHGTNIIEECMNMFNFEHNRNKDEDDE